MRKSFLFVAVCALALCACLQTDEIEKLATGGVPLVFSASYDTDPGTTRTVLQSDGKVFWSPKESIQVFKGSQGAEFVSSNTEASAAVLFEGELDVSAGVSAPFLAVYPYRSTDSSDGTSVTTLIPAVQRACAGTFADGMAVSVACTRDPGDFSGEIPLSFHNVCSGLKFSLAHSDVTSVTFRGNAGESIAGSVKIGFDADGLPASPEVVSGEQEIRLTFNEGEEFPRDTWFYLTLLPQKFAKGFTLVFETPTMTGSYVYASEAVFTRSVWKRAERIDEAVVFHFPDLASAAMDFREQDAHNVTPARLANDEYALRLAGDDPYLFTFPFAEDLDPSLRVVEFEYRLEHPVDLLQLFLVQQGIATESASRKYGSLPATDRYKTFRADLSDFRDGGWGKAGDAFRLDPGQSGNGTMHVRNFVIRQMTEEEQRHGVETDDDKDKREMSERLSAYLDHSYPSVITSVTVSSDKVTVQGRCGGEGTYLLAEITPWQDVTEMSEFPYATAVSGGTFTLSIDRMAMGLEGIDYDRVFSKWAVVKVENGKQLLDSHARYADEVTPKRSPASQPLRHKKGLAAGSGTSYYQDLDDLDIASITMNVDLSKIIAQEGGSGFNYGGYSFTIGNAAGGGRGTLDKITKQAAQRGIVVSAILLAPTGSNYTDPENTGGYYSMPNLTTARAFNLYAAVVEYLASRFSESNSTHGRIHHWILHNEVDQGLIWTNMGNQPMLRYLDRYIKSMRICYNIVRQYDPEASVLGSYTHSWTSEGGGYAPKAMLERTVDYSVAEGDFRWGVAYHPYPQDLSRPDFWARDTEATDSDDTHFVTFRNPEVIDRWIRQPRNLYKGTQKRVLFFSENGTSSPSYSESDLALQAAGACLAWKKIQALDGIDAVQWHNWRDNAFEAAQGLRLGLHAMAAEGMADYACKPVWYVWQAAGTDQEETVFAPYLDVIGLSSWE